MNRFITFEQNPLPDTGAHKAALSAAKLELLKQRLRRESNHPRERAIQARDDRRQAPLSFAQELLWLVDQLTPNSVVYSVPRAMRMAGDLNVDALQQTLDAIVARHEVLRTTINLVDGAPVQFIQDAQSVRLPIIDLSGFAEAEREKEVQRLLVKLARHPFDLSRDLLLRATLFRLAAQEHVLLLESHHIASDGWSKAVLFKELNALYGAFCAGQPWSLPELPLQYADFACWQREMLREENLEKELTYWKQQLTGAPALLEFPCARPRPALQTFRGKGKRFHFPKSLLEGFKALGQSERATLFITLLAGFNAFLQRYTKQEDIVIGTPIAGRGRPELENLIGYFTNTLALRTDLSGNPTFRQLLRRVRETALAAYEHQDLPFEKLVLELKPERNRSHSPVFQVMFSVGHYASAVPELPGLTLSPVVVDRGIARFDLLVGMTECPDGLAVGLEYSTDLFDETTITRLAGHFRTLLEGILANPDQRLWDLPLLTETQRQQILVEWNATDAEFPRHACLHHLIEAQVERTPESVAAVFQGQRLTYRELNARANQLAHYLRKRGVGPDVRVGICVARSLELAVGLLGILKAGGAYLPLDPAHPKERLASMLEDAQVCVLLSQQRLEKVLPPCQEVVYLDSAWKDIARESTANPQSGARAENLAYVISTSGSSGKPKGVLISHRGVVNHNLAAIKHYDLQARDRVLQFSSVSFDIAVEELFPTWIAGAAVILRPEDMAISGKRFMRWLRQERITVLDLPTAFFHEWVQELALSEEPLPETLRAVIVGGEKALATAYSTWLKVSKGRVRWFNTYGPTETSVVATLYEPPVPPLYLPPASGGDTEGGREPISDMPIGRPIANTQIYILDSQLQPVPIGLPGELYIGGAGIARGYLNRPDLTAERFLPNPFCDEPGARLYRTGDLARYREDGNIEFVGRMDHQVKIRGFRIELEEIEAVLGQHPGVRDVVVVAREDRPGDKRLVAYVVPQGRPEPSIRELREYLKTRLPEYMVPSIFMPLASLPLTPRGKLDRQALPAPGHADHKSESTFAAPRDSLELQLTMIWEKVLARRPISIRDNFFDLGGHSLLAVRLFSYIQKVFGKSLPLATLFQAPTIEQLAEIVRQDLSAHAWPTVMEIQAPAVAWSGDHATTGLDHATTGLDHATTGLPLFCVAVPNVNALGYAFLARHLGPDQPVYGLQSQDPDHVRSQGRLYTQTEYEALARDYVTAMRTVQEEGPYLLAGMCEGAHIAFEMVRQLEADNQKVGLLAILDAWPIENTMSYWLWQFRRYARQLRTFVNLRPTEQLPSFLRKLQGAIKRLTGKATTEATQAPAFRFHDFWLSRYWPGKGFKPPQCASRITVFRVRKQPYYRIKDPHLGWAERTRAGVELHLIPGQHSAVLREPQVEVLARELADCIARASAT